MSQPGSRAALLLGHSPKARLEALAGENGEPRPPDPGAVAVFVGGS